MAKRNEKGVGSVFCRKNGQWVAKMTKNGKTMTMLAKSETDGYEKLKQIKKEFQRLERMKKAKEKLTSDPRKITTATMFERFFFYKRYKCRKCVREQTLMRQEMTVSKHILPLLGDVPFVNITSADVDMVLDKMFNKGLGYSSIKKVYEAFNACFRYAVNIDRIIKYEDNPMLQVEMFQSAAFKQKQVQAYTPDEIIKITAECLKIDDDGKFVNRYGRLFLFILNTGLREGEVCALNKNDLLLDDRMVRVYKTTVTMKTDDEAGKKKWKTIVQSVPKTESSKRVVPLNKTALKYAQMVFSEFPDNDLFVYTVNNRVINPSSLNRYFDKILLHAGVQKKGGLHVLRDTFASRLFDNDIDILTVSSLLGHSGSRVTEQHYIEITNYRKASAVELIDAI